MTKQQLQDELKSRLSAEGSTFYTETKLEDWIGAGYLWVAGLRSWPVLERAKKTTSVAQSEFDYDIYDYPSVFRTDSLVRLAVGDELWGEKDEEGKIRQGKIAYDDFLSFIENVKSNSATSKKVWSDWGRQYFIYPKLESYKVISAWGSIYPSGLESSISLTVFEGEPELEEAIIKKAFSIAMIKGKKKKEGQAEEAEAANLVNAVWSKIAQRQAQYLRQDKPFFTVPDFIK